MHVEYAEEVQMAKAPSENAYARTHERFTLPVLFIKLFYIAGTQ
jgi:hypothetical protein